MQKGVQKAPVAIVLNNLTTSLMVCYIAIECAIKYASEFYLFPDSVLPIIIRLH